VLMTSLFLKRRLCLVLRIVIESTFIIPKRPCLGNSILIENLVNFFTNLIRLEVDLAAFFNLV
jgi:hypothetical protein